MKVAAKIAVVIVLGLALVLVVLRITGLNPIGNTPGPGNYPGLWLSGQVIATPVTDWLFATKYQTEQSADTNLVFDSAFGNYRFHRL